MLLGILPLNKAAQQSAQVFLCCSEVFPPSSQGEPVAGPSTDVLQLGGGRKVPDTLGN